jgi:hypothetical protein
MFKVLADLQDIKTTADFQLISLQNDDHTLHFSRLIRHAGKSEISSSPHVPTWMLPPNLQAQLITSCEENDQGG